MTTWFQQLRKVTHFCPRCGGVLQLELTPTDPEGHAQEALRVRCPRCYASTTLSAEDVERAVTAQLLVRVGLRLQRVCVAGVAGARREEVSA